MVRNSRGKTFSCLECGTVFVAHPPDDFHQTASIKKSEVESAIKMIHVCKKCKSKNVLYWGEQKVLGMGF